jgi:small-conductance mechanosensitive channel
MTFAEILTFCILIGATYFLLRPLQRRLESWLYRKLRKTGSEKPIIEIKDYKKKD